jgi:HK97 family phage major capsid protein/HK97 family phage prohead protease
MIHHRTFQIEARATADGRQIEASLSSELPVYRPGLGNEILEHTVDAIDLSRAPLPLLTSHDAKNMPIGVVEGVRLVGRKLRGILRFSASDQATGLWEDVKAGILRNISIGYQILDGYKDGDKYIATRWQPLEISLVSVPADPTVGIGRSFDMKGHTMNPTDTTSSNAMTRSQRRGVESSSRDAAEIAALGDAHASRGGDKLAMQYIRDGRPLEEFRAALLTMMATDRAPQTDIFYPGGDDNRQPSENYSLLRAVDAMATGDWREAGFEREMSQELSRVLGRKPKGFMVPFAALTGQRVMTTGGSTTGATLVPTLHQGFIELLRNHCRVIEAGATVMGGLAGSIEIPKQTAAATAEWLAEDDALSGSDMGFGAVTMTPKTVGAMLKWSRRMTHSAIPEIEQLARNDLAQVIGTAIDRAALHGLGSSNQPSGVYVASNTNSVAMGGVPTYGKLVEMAAELAKDNSLQGRVAFLTTPGMASKLAQTLVASSAGSEMVWSGSLVEGRMAGFPAFATNQVSSTLGAGSEHGVVLANWAELIIGMWGGGVDILVDPYTDADRGRVRITTFCDLDIALRHPESFCKATGATV